MTFTRKVFGNPEKQVNKKMLKINVKHHDAHISRTDIFKYLSFHFVVKSEAEDLGA